MAFNVASRLTWEDRSRSHSERSPAEAVPKHQSSDPAQSSRPFHQRNRHRGSGHAALPFETGKREGRDVYQFDDRFLMGGVAPIISNLPAIPAKVIGTPRVGLDDESRLSGARLRNNLLHRVDQQARHQRRGYIRVPVKHPCDACLRPAAAFRQQLDDELGGTGAKRPPEWMAKPASGDDDLRPRMGRMPGIRVPD